MISETFNGNEESLKVVHYASNTVSYLFQIGFSGSCANYGFEEGKHGNGEIISVT